MYPELINMGLFPIDVVEKAKEIFSSLGQNQNIILYSDCQGLKKVRESVRQFLLESDQVDSNISKIFLVNGASDGITSMISLILKNPNDSIMIPIPQYPLYNALISLNGGQACPYYLNEEKNWAIDFEDLIKNYEIAKKKNLNVKAIVIINPGNPTGQLFGKEDIDKIVKFSFDNNLTILADEVYQNNIYINKKFVSFRKVISESPFPYNKTMIASSNSTSKGYLGECGFRGGYMELMNFPEEIVEQLRRARYSSYSPNIIGQLLTEAMVNPPKKGRNSEDVVSLYEQEKAVIHKGLQERAIIIAKSLNQIKNITCQPIEGAMYGFPRVFLTPKAIEAAKSRSLHPDAFYSVSALENMGLMVVPGSGFGQKDGTYHFRITNLIWNKDELHEMLKSFSKFNEEFFSKYS